MSVVNSALAGEVTRRSWLSAVGGVVGGVLVAPPRAVRGQSPLSDAQRPSHVIDAHQHLWDLDALRPPWLATAPAILRQRYGLAEYQEAVRGWNVDTLYMEIDVGPDSLEREAEVVADLCRDRRNRILGAVLGARPAAADFAEYVDRQQQRGAVKGFRQVLHGDTPRGFCLEPDFVRGIRLLGERGLSFDLCPRPRELDDACRLARLCPETRFVLDHCGNADPKAFGRYAAAGLAADHDAPAWREAIGRLAALPNVVCKISGIVARAPAGWTDADLAPIVDHCWREFGPQRLLFGGDWPVCLLGASLRGWLEALARIVADRPEAERNLLWRDNARAFFGLA